METPVSQQRAIDFLHEELNVIDRKISHLKSARDLCDDHLEDKGLQALQHSAFIERDVISRLLECQDNDEALSLDAQLLEHIKCAGERSRQQSSHWHRGEPTPNEYWDTEVQRNLLGELLTRFHAWQHRTGPVSEQVSHERLRAVGTDRAAEALGQGSAHPWYMVAAEAQNRVMSNGKSHSGSRERHHKRGYSRSAEMLFEDVTAALERADLRLDHLEIIAEPLGNVIVTGYAHDPSEHDRIIDTTLRVEGVFEVIEDIKEVAQVDCPLCHPAKATSPRSEAQRHNNHHPNGNR